ncbi:MAG TPA: hypothetical protein VGG14_15325 [Candidatus Sulfotelmatobacter sp.]|jgi:hypothetical protein
MTRINLFHSNPASVAWGKIKQTTNIFKNVFDSSSPLIFAAALIACSFAVGCSSEKPQPPTAISQPAISQSTPQTATTTAPATVAAAGPATPKPTHKRVVRKVPPAATYADKTTGVSFQYPRNYALKTGDSATELISTDAIPMDFTQTGGVAIAAVALPESTYPNSDLTNAYFEVSVNKTLTAEQCNEFSVPQPDPARPSDSQVQAAARLATPPVSKLLIGDMELTSAETSSSTESTKGPREESSRYFHVFQNGGCYEFALKVSTTKPNPEQTADSGTKIATKAVDRDEVFHRLEKILATVKISPVAQELKADAKTNSVPSPSPAQ